MADVTAILTQYRAKRYRAHCWRRQQAVAVKGAMALGMAGVTGLMAQLRVPLPFTPVPVTMQVLAVLLAGVVLGRGYAGLSQVFYVTLGAAGLPWFAGYTGGAGVLVGATGGYLVGFVVAAELVGFVNARYVGVRGFRAQVGLMAAASAVILACGATYLSVLLHTSLWATLAQGVLPFLPGDAAKVLLAASMSTALLPKAAYNGEVDADER